MGEIFKLFGTIGVDTSDAEKGIDNVTGKAKKAGNGFAGFFKTAAANVAKFVTAVGVFKLLNGAIGLVKGSIQSAFGRIDVMEQFNRVMTVMLGSSDAAANSLSKITEIVTGTAYGLDVAAQGVQNFVTSNMDIGRAEKTVESWGNAVAFYGDGSNQTFATVNDAMAKMSAKGSISMEQLNRIIESGIPALQIYADATGMSVEQVSDEISKGNISADKFIDTMNKAFDDGTANFAGIAGAAKEAGASWGAAFDNMKAAVTRGVVAIIQQIDLMLTENGLPDMRTMVSNFGKAFEDTLKKAAEYIGPLIENLVKLKNQIQDSTAWQSLKEVIIAVKDGFKDLWGQLQDSGILDTVWEAITQLWEALLEIDFRQVITDVKEFIDTWSPLILGIMGAIVAFQAISAIVPVVVGAFKAFSIIKTLVSSVGLLQTAITFLAPVLFAINWPLVAITAAIGAVIAIGVLLWKNWDTIKEKAISIWGSIKTFFLDTWNSIVDSVFNFIDNLTQGFTDKMESIRSFFYDIWNNIYDTIVGFLTNILDMGNGHFQDFVYNIEMAMTNLWHIFETYWTFIYDTFMNVTGMILAIFSGDWATLGDMVRQQMDLIKNTIITIWMQVTGFFSSIIEAIKSLVLGGFQKLGEKLQPIFDFISNVITIAWEVIKTIFIVVLGLIMTVIAYYWNAYASIINVALDFIKGIVTTVWGFIQNVIETTMNFIRETIVPIWESIKESVGNILNAIATFISNVWNSIKNTTQSIWNVVFSFISSIWEKIKTKVQAVANVIATFISSIWNSIKTKTQAVWNIISTFISSVWNKIKSIITSAVNAVKSVVINVFNAIKNTVTSIWNAIRNVINSVWNSVKSIIRNATNIVKNTVTNAFNSLKTSVTNKWNQIKSAIEKPITKAKDTVKTMIDKIKGFFNFQWKLPKLKMPKFSVSGSSNPIDWITQGVPKLKVDWFAKGGIMTKATAFGMNGDSIMAGGEAGREAILPLNKDTLGGIGDGIAATMDIGSEQLAAILREIKDELKELLDKKLTVLIQIDGRTIAKVIGEYTDEEEGTRIRNTGRGLA